MDKYREGRLKNAVNILNCKRLKDATIHQWGDTNNITHHATVPLKSADRRFGVLNVASPGKEHFTQEELELLQAVAFQIGGAIERMRLHEAERKRAQLFTRLGDFSRSIHVTLSKGITSGDLIERAVELIGDHFDWPIAALLEVSGEDLVLRAIHMGDGTINPFIRIPIAEVKWLGDLACGQSFGEVAGEEAADLLNRRGLRRVLPKIKSAAAASLSFGSATSTGFLLVGHDKQGELSHVEGEVLEALAEHIAVALESARLEENRRELARIEERNRLARDLHDSVSQMLFSLSMTAKGVEALLSNGNLDPARSTLKDVQLYAYTEEWMGFWNCLTPSKRRSGESVRKH